MAETLDDDVDFPHPSPRRRTTASDVFVAMQMNRSTADQGATGAPVHGRAAAGRRVPYLMAGKSSDQLCGLYPAVDSPQVDPMSLFPAQHGRCC